MCELFAMSSRVPTEVRFSLETFSRRGGLSGRNKDGWGLAYYEENDVRLIKEIREKQGDWEHLPAPDGLFTKPFSLIEFREFVRKLVSA